MTAATNPAELFWAKVTKTDTCWLWTAAIDADGYGSFCPRKRTTRVHRYAYELHKGPIPAGLYIDHLCHNADPACPGGDTCLHRRCVNPAHLEAVTPRENSLRGVSSAALNAAKTHCDSGHEFTEANTYAIPPSRSQRHGGRGCRACRRSARARYEVKRRAAKAVA